MGLLKWRDNPAGLEDHLKKFMKVDGEEVVKVTKEFQSKTRVAMTLGLTYEPSIVCQYC